MQLYISMDTLKLFVFEGSSISFIQRERKDD